MDELTFARLWDEDEQLLERIKKLEAFVNSENFELLPYAEVQDLREQLRLMKEYSIVLQRRLSRQPNDF